MKGNILIIDDDRMMAGLVQKVLKDGGYKALHAETADEGFSMLKGEQFDLLLLDFDLPGISGLNLLELIKKEPRTQNIPVIMITVKGEESNRVRGLNTGADDYLVKPFSHKELLARVEALLRRVQRQGQVNQTIEAGGISIDFGSRRVTVKNKPVELTPLEFDLLTMLMQRQGQVLTYRNITDALSSGEKIMTSGNLYVRIKDLRQKLGAAGGRIETVYGIGYRFQDA